MVKEHVHSEISGEGTGTWSVLDTGMQSNVVLEASITFPVGVMGHSHPRQYVAILKKSLSVLDAVHCEGTEGGDVESILPITDHIERSVFIDVVEVVENKERVIGRVRGVVRLHRLNDGDGLGIGYPNSPGSVVPVGEHVANWELGNLQFFVRNGSVNSISTEGQGYVVKGCSEVEEAVAHDERRTAGDRSIELDSVFKAIRFCKLSPDRIRISFLPPLDGSVKSIQMLFGSGQL